MQKENTKQTFTVRLSEETANLCVAGMAMDDCRSRNEFIEKAIRHYTGYLSAEKNKVVLGEQIQKVVESSVKSELSYGSGVGKTAADHCLLFSNGRRNIDGAPQSMPARSKKHERNFISGRHDKVKK